MTAQHLAFLYAQWMDRGSPSEIPQHPSQCRWLKFYLWFTSILSSEHSLQSTSKPFTYAVGLNELGRNIVHQYVGQEPSGRMFNELKLDANSEKKSRWCIVIRQIMTLTHLFSDKPHNPMLNSGAIMSAAILLNLLNPKMDSEKKFGFFSDYLQVELLFLFLFYLIKQCWITLKMTPFNYLSISNSVWLGMSSWVSIAQYFTLSVKQPIETTLWSTTWRKRVFSLRGFRVQQCMDFYFKVFFLFSYDMT